jgi:1-acyl-sn-glycerol-3-phosphate acyltransferase
MKNLYKVFHRSGLILLKIWVQIALLVYFRRIKVTGRNKIPKDKPIIFAPNHQYAFMDALLLVLVTKKIPYFLVRADIFRRSFANFLLRTLKMMPVYRRQRDNVDVISKNEITFTKCVEILKKGKYLTIFPEGNHSKIRKIRIIRKGLHRIGFRAINEKNARKDLVIIPVGINYDDHSKFQSDILIKFGDPIDLEDYNEAYHENQAKAFSDLSNSIYDQLVNLTVNIQHTDSYKFYENVLKIYTPHFMRKIKLSYKNLLNRFKAYKMIIAGLDIWKDSRPKDFKKFETKNNKFFRQQIRATFDPVCLGNFFDSRLQQFVNYLLLILFWPIYMYGLINNLIAITLPHIIGQATVKDDHFLSSVKLAIGLLSFPISYLIQGIIFYRFFPNGWYVTLYILSIIITGILAKIYQNWIHRFWEMFKIRLLMMRQKREFIKIKRNYNDLINTLNENLLQ